MGVQPLIRPLFNDNEELLQQRNLSGFFITDSDLEMENAPTRTKGSPWRRLTLLPRLTPLRRPR